MNKKNEHSLCVRNDRAIGAIIRFSSEHELKETLPRISGFMIDRLSKMAEPVPQIAKSAMETSKGISSGRLTVEAVVSVEAAFWSWIDDNGYKYDFSTRESLAARSAMFSLEIWKQGANLDELLGWFLDFSDAAGCDTEDLEYLIEKHFQTAV
jgi:hypothetical protein